MVTEKAYERFLKDGPQEGLTQAEIIGIYKADRQAALNAISQNAVSGKGIEGGSKTLQTGGRQIDYNAYIKRLETIDIEYETYVWTLRIYRKLLKIQECQNGKLVK